MKSIYKYRLALTDKQMIELPERCKILSVQQDTVQMICLWALVETSPEHPIRCRNIHIYGTGYGIGLLSREADSAVHLDYLATLQIPGGYVWHVFIEREFYEKE